MTTSPKILITTLTCITLLVCSSAFAQTSVKSSPEERTQRWDTWMKENLAITPQQEDQVHAINLKYAQKNEHLKTSTESRKSKFQELKSSDKQKDAELRAILTKDQFNLYQDKKKDFQRQLMEKIKN